jgi:hypothetical protein
VRARRSLLFLRPAAKQSAGRRRSKPADSAGADTGAGTCVRGSAGTAPPWEARSRGPICRREMPAEDENYSVRRRRRAMAAAAASLDEGVLAAAVSARTVAVLGHLHEVLVAFPLFDLLLCLGSGGDRRRLRL